MHEIFFSKWVTFARRVIFHEGSFLHESKKKKDKLVKKQKEKNY